MWKLLDLKFHTDEDSKQLNELPSPRASFIRLIRSIRVQKRINVPLMNQLMSIYVSKVFIGNREQMMN